MKGDLHQRARMDKAALSVSLWPVGDGEKEALCKRLDRAIATADRLGLNSAATARGYRADLNSPIGYALTRHFTTQICTFIEGKSE